MLSVVLTDGRKIFQPQWSGVAVCPTFFRCHPAQPPLIFTSCHDQSQTTSNFSDTCESSPHGALPGSHGNPYALTVKPAARQPRHHSAPVPKPRLHLPNMRIGAECCYNRPHSLDNKRNRLAPRQVPPRLEVPLRQAHVSQRPEHQRYPHIRSAQPAAQHPTRIRLY